MNSSHAPATAWGSPGRACPTSPPAPRTPPRPPPRSARCRSPAGPWRSCPSTAGGVAEAGADQMDDAGLHDRGGNTALTAVGQPLQPVADDEEHVPHAAVPQVGQHAHPELRRLPAAVAGPQPEHVPVPAQVDPDRGVERLVADLPVADLDVDRVDEDRRVHPLQRPRRPGLHVLHHPVGDPGDGVLGHAGAVDLGEVRARSPRWSAPSHTARSPPRPHRTAAAAASPRSPARTCRPGPAAPRPRPGRRCRSAPSWTGCRCGSCRRCGPRRRACRSRGARSSPPPARTPAPAW